MRDLDDWRFLQSSERLGTAASVGFLPLAVLVKEERAPAARLVELFPLPERLIRCVRQVGRELLAGVREQALQLRADVVRRFLDGRHPWKLLTLIELDGREPWKMGVA